MTTEELFECTNCHMTGPLDEHGRCVRCGSDAVISEAKLIPSKEQ